MYETRRRRKEGRKGGGGGGGGEGERVSYYFRFAYVSCFGPLCSERRAPKACPIQKGTRGRRKKRGGISVRNRNILLLPHTPNIEAKYARIVTDKVVVVARKTIFLPFSPPTKRIKGDRKDRATSFARLSYIPIDAKYPTATSSIAPPIHQYFLSNFLSSLFSPKGKKKKRNRFSETRLEISIDRKIYRWIYWAYGRLGLTKEIRMEGWHRYTLTRLSDARLLRRDAPQPRLSEAWNDIGLLPHRNLLSGDRLVIVTNRPLYS